MGIALLQKQCAPAFSSWINGMQSKNVLSGVCNLITMKVASDDCELRVAKRAHERLSCATKRTRLCVQGVASGSVATNKPELVGQHGIAQNNVEQTCQSVLLEQLTHETYDLREVLHRARVKYTPYSLYLSAAKI